MIKTNHIKYSVQDILDNPENFKECLNCGVSIPKEGNKCNICHGVKFKKVDIKGLDYPIKLYGKDQKFSYIIIE